MKKIHYNSTRKYNICICYISHTYFINLAMHNFIHNLEKNINNFINIINNSIKELFHILHRDIFYIFLSINILFLINIIQSNTM